MGLAFLLGVVLTRRLGAEEYGRLSMLLMVAQVLLLATANWTQLGFVNFAAREFERTGTVVRTFWSRMFICAPVAALCTILLFWTRDTLAAFVGVPKWALAAAIAYFLTSFLVQSFGAAYQARKEMGRYGATLVAERGILLLLVLALPLATTSVGWVMTMYAIAAGLVAVGAAATLGTQTLLPARTDGATPDLLVYSLPLLVWSLAGFFGANWFDFLVIRRYRPISDVGLYSLGWQLSAVAQQITIVFSTLMLPRIATLLERDDAEAIRRFLQRGLPQWLLATSILFGALQLIIQRAVPLIFGDEFVGAVPVLGLLLVGSSAVALFNGLLPLVSADGSTWSLSGIAVASSGVNVALNFALVPRWGIEGAALGTAVAYAVSAVAVLWVVNARYGATGWLAAYLLPVLLIYAATQFLPPLAASLVGGGALLVCCTLLLSLRRQAIAVGQ